jgi:hypothetical protein
MNILLAVSVQNPPANPPQILPQRLAHIGYIGQILHIMHVLYVAQKGIANLKKQCFGFCLIFIRIRPDCKKIHKTKNLSVVSEQVLHKLT